MLFVYSFLCSIFFVLFLAHYILCFFLHIMFFVLILAHCVLYTLSSGLCNSFLHIMFFILFFAYFATLSSTFCCLYSFLRIMFFILFFAHDVHCFFLRIMFFVLFPPYCASFLRTIKSQPNNINFEETCRPQVVVNEFPE